MTETVFEPSECRAARALLEWTQEQLALAASVGRMTVKRYEAGEVLRPAQTAAISRALAKEGLVPLHGLRVTGGRRLIVGVGLLSEPGE